MTEWLGADDAAEYTGYSVHTIRDAAASGELSGTRRPGTTRSKWKFRRADLDAWLEAGRRTAPRAGRRAS